MSARYSFTIHRILMLIVIVLGSCKSTGSQNKAIFQTVATVVAPQELLVPSDTLHSVYEGLLRRKPVIAFYQHTKGKLVWLDNKGLKDQGDSMITILQRVSYYGLPPERYHLNELNDLNGRNSKIDQLRTETLLTDAFLALAHDLKFGISKTFTGVLHDSSHVELLKVVVREGALKQTLDSQEPKFSGYHSLKQALKVILDQLAVRNTEDSIRKRYEAKLIGINLERWRRENKSLGKRYIMINIPSFMLYVVENTDTILSSKIIVGNAKNPTPQLSSIITSLTIYPYWHVPRKIAVEEYLPAIQKDTSFIKRNNFDVLDRKGKVINPDTILWDGFHKNYFPVSLRQREGVENSLGVIKFYFTNPYAVFLHDTNAKKLFRSKARAFSHGCIRMEESEALAHYLVTGEPSKKSRMVERYLNEKRRSVITLQHPISIHIRYFTVDVIGGEPIFYSDIYGTDMELREELFPVEPAGIL